VLGSARSVLMKKPASGSPLPGSAMALYNFNENTGTTAADSSGNNRTITLNSATWDASGHTGSAISSTGTTNLGGKVSFSSPSAAITIMGWVKPLNLTAGTTRPAFGFVDVGNNTGCFVFTQRGDFGTANVLQGDIRIGGTLRALNSTALTVGVWTHVAITYDGATAILYKDGVSSASVSATGNVGTGDALCVASWMSAGTYSPECSVDDVRVYNSALTSGQIVTGMNTPV
jgi:hypothetical protein